MDSRYRIQDDSTRPLFLGPETDVLKMSKEEFKKIQVRVTSGNIRKQLPSTSTDDLVVYRRHGEGTRPMFPPENFPLPKDDDRVISFVGGERGLNIIPSPTPSFGTLPNSSSGRSPPSQRSIVVTPDQLPNSNSKSSKFRQDAKSSRRVPSNSPNNKRGHSSYRSRSTSKDKSRVSRRVANDDQRSSSRSTYYKGRVVSDKQSNADSKNKPHENESARSGGLSKSNRSRVNSCSPERSRHRKPSGSNSSSSRRRRHTESRGRSRSRSRSVGRRSRSIDRRSDNRDKWRKPERHSPEGGRYGRKSRETQGKHRPSRFPNEREQYSYRSANDMEPQPAPMQPIIHMQQEHQQQAAQQPQQPGRTAPMGPSFIPMHRFYTPMIPQVIPTFMPPRYRPPLPRPPPGVYHPF